MSDYLDKAKVASKYVLLPTGAGCYLALKKMRGDLRVDERTYLQCTSREAVADPSPVDLAERGEMRHMVPAAGKEKANETACNPGWGDTPNFRVERTLGKLSKNRGVL